MRPHSDWNSARVRSYVQHVALAGLAPTAGRKGSEHLARRAGRSRMSVVVARSQCECLQTSCRSAVTAASHSTQPAPCAMAVAYASSVCSGRTMEDPRCAMAKSWGARGSAQPRMARRAPSTAVFRAAQAPGATPAGQRPEKGNIASFHLSRS